METIVRAITKEEYSQFIQSLESEKLTDNEPRLISNITELVNEHENDEMPVHGCFNEIGELLGVVHFSEEWDYYFFDEDDEQEVEEEEEERELITAINTIFVHPKEKGKDIGKSLVEFVIQEASTNCIFADPVDMNAWRFFQCVGFDTDVKERFLQDDDWSMFYFKEKITFNEKKEKNYEHI